MRKILLCSYLRSCLSDSHTVQAVLLGVKASMIRTRKRDAWRSNKEDALLVPSWMYVNIA